MSDLLNRTARKIGNAFRTRSERLPAAAAAPVVLCIDDDEAICRVCELIVRRAGFRFEAVHNGREGLASIQKNEYAAILLDLQMPYMHGATLLALVGRERPEALRRMIVMTALPEAALAGMRDAVAAVVRKPLNHTELVERVRACCDPELLPDEVGELSATAHL